MLDRTVTLLLTGDVMTGRGIDQILPSPGGPALRERYVRDARTYVELAEAAHGPIPRPVDVAYPWGAALAVADTVRPDVRIVNVETSVTSAESYAPGKGIHYRMHPGNVGCLTAVRPDVCVLANNHVLDFGPAGLVETLDVLAGAGLRTAGAGRDVQEAWRPAVLERDVGRTVVWSVATPSSGVPADWSATDDRPGVALLGDLSDRTADWFLRRVRAAARPEDVVVVSVHWGSNWGYDVPEEQVRFAHALVDGGVDVVHGHSSHHPRPIEVYRDRLVLYGCGDLVNDYEGIAGYEQYRDDLRLLYVATLSAGSGALQRLRMVPLRARRMRLEPAARSDAEWLAQTLRDAGCSISLGTEGDLLLA